MFLQPRFFNEFLIRSGYDAQVYDAMKSDDLAEVVIVALDILRKTNNLPDIANVKKSEMMSDTLREAGNKFLTNMNYKSALNCYNKALACAPINSRAMALAYSNRSFIMLRLKHYRACVADIDHCFRIGCPEFIKQKLFKRREDANKYVLMDSLSFTVLKTYTNNFFSFKSVCHKDVPFVSKDINIAIEISQPKITAANSINSGTIIAVEKAYMTAIGAGDHYNTCYYCLTITPNLIPCDTCCTALYCSEKCKQICNDQYHNYECYIVQVIGQFCNGAASKLMIKSVFKLKNNLKWNEFITESKTLGNSRIKKSTTREVFNSESDCSILAFPENKPFVYGIMYDASFLCAALLHYMLNIPRFMPNSNKDDALRALARVMLYLCVYGLQSDVVQTVTDSVRDSTYKQMAQNCGWYTFHGKLKVACNGNVVTSWLHNKAVLIAIRKIVPGEEITVSNYEPMATIPKYIINTGSFMCRGLVCRCLKCTRESFKDDTLSCKQIEFMKKVDLVKLKACSDITQVHEVLEKCRELLDILSDVPNSKEYITSLEVFRNCVIVCEALETENFDIL